MDIILYNIGLALLLVFVGYFFGSIPNGIWIGKLVFHKDPRDYGSGNSGGTNVGRVFGKKFGVLVIFLDALKIIIPLYGSWALFTFVPIYNGLPLVPNVYVAYFQDTSNYLVQWPIYYMTMVGCSLGHCFPIFSGFRGGKNVSSFVGFSITTSWLFGFIPGLLYLLILKWKKMVSLASISMSWISVTFSWIWSILMLTGVIKGTTLLIPGYGPLMEFGYVYSIILTFAATVLTIRHKSNIIRIKNGTESKIKWMK